MDKMTKEHLTSLLINGTSEQIQEAIDDIHPADILDVLQDHHSQLNNILSKLPNDIIADVIEEEEDEENLKATPNMKSLKHSLKIVRVLSQMR